MSLFIALGRRLDSYSVGPAPALVPEEHVNYNQNTWKHLKLMLHLGQTVKKQRVQPGKTVPREYPRVQPEGTPEG